MDYKLLLDSVVMAGEIMLESGAETWRVEDTMLRMLKMSKLKTAEVFAMTTGFTVTLDDPSMDSMTVVRRIENRSMNLERVDRINQISRNFCCGAMTVEEMFREVKKNLPGAGGYKSASSGLYDPDDRIYTDVRRGGA